jgi:uncharacterized protein
MTVSKFILFFGLSFSFFTSCKGQTAPAKSKNSSQIDTSEYSKLQLYRQLFWNNLPKPSSWTNDYEGLFSDEEKVRLDSLMGSFEKETTTQFCLVTLDTIHTSKQKFNELALHIANAWGVGQKEKNNGVTICISRGHRMNRICNGYGIEKILTDNETKEILDEFFIGNFKKGEYFKGTFNGIITLIEKLRIKLKS